MTALLCALGLHGRPRIGHSDYPALGIRLRFRECWNCGRRWL